MASRQRRKQGYLSSFRACCCLFADVNAFFETAVYSQVHNKRGGQNKRGGFKDFGKLINGGFKISGGWGQNIKEKRRK